ncbi:MULTISPECIES: aminopeptidase P family protein [Rhodomicrobium]|uniref:aminopeptidase P family protein n=1 Tax=Rhodomicrobium TaxID=1068 RepID=UPI000B4B24E9|nr:MULTISPECIES: aminopeptidase P family protein [Rhodomicrobium]
MFQNFDDVGGPAHGAERLRLLRMELDRAGLTGFLVPRADEFQNEYVPADAERLLWLTGFSGSWGTAAVLMDKAALVIDGRYTLQAAAQVDPAAFEVVNVADKSVSGWLEVNLRVGDRLGYDPRLHTVAQVEALAKCVEKAGAQLVAVEANPLAAIWTDPPAPAQHPIALQPIAFAGIEAADKIAEIQDRLAREKIGAVVISALDSIAWLFNIRGQDLPHTPFVLSYAIVPVEGKALLFVDGRKLTPDVREALSAVAEIAEPTALLDSVRAFGSRKAKVQIDPAAVSQWYLNHLVDSGAVIVREPDPCVLPKARKNRAEIAGSRAAHLRDGVAVSRFISWLDSSAPAGNLDEIAVATRLEKFRRESPELREISFDTIAGSGPNGAIVHYRPTRSTSRRIEPGSLLLIDSGGQYADGTTDITRTLAIGEPTPDMRRHFTLVLQGHIAIATARFPKGTRGNHLDALARRALWSAGLDYDHGTGHGVGSFLSVHEGPQNIARRESVELEPGMILSNEPGFYRTGEYGIRIENLILVTEPAEIPGGDRPMMGFETLTLAPFDRRLIDTALLSSAEIAWIDAYHAEVLAKLAPGLDAETLAWLRDATAPLAR